jgi:hypothetical protein
MNTETELKQLTLIVEDLARLAEALRDKTDDFPALHRNSRRILASVEMLRINLGQEAE